MPNARFDLQEWRTRHLPNIDPAAWSIPGPIKSPMDIVIREERIRAHRHAFDSSAGRVVDYLVHGFGEPSLPWHSKMGGVPHRSKSRPWPLTPDGNPMEFFGQINLADSRDLVPEAKAPLLLMFHCGEDSCTSEEFHFEWAEEEALRDPLTSGDVPAFEFPLHIQFPIHYQILRSAEWARPTIPPGPQESLPDPVTATATATATGVAVTTKSAQKPDPSLICSKVGGLPNYFGAGEGDAPQLPGRYFAAINSLQISTSCPYPAVDRIENLTREECGGYYAFSFIMLGDVGTLFLNIDPDGNVYCAGQCH